MDVKEGRVKYWTKGIADKDITEMSDELGIAEAKLHARLAEKSEADLKDVEKAPRVHMKHLDPMKRRTNFEEVIAGLSEEDAEKEADRCLSCGICSECYQCVDACIAKAINHEDTFDMETVEVGAVIAARASRPSTPVCVASTASAPVPTWSLHPVRTHPLRVRPVSWACAEAVRRQGAQENSLHPVRWAPRHQLRQLMVLFGMLYVRHQGGHHRQEHAKVSSRPFSSWTSAPMARISTGS